MRKHPVFVGVVLLALLCPAARGSLIVYGGQSDYPLAPGASLDDVRLTVELTVIGEVATMTFVNTSLSEAVFKEIVVDTCDDDRGLHVLWNPLILTDTADVAYTVRESNGLPGYHEFTSEVVMLLEFAADSPPPRRGLGVGETLQVQFATSLADGSDIADYLAFFDGGADSSDHAIGFHAISADVVDGESLSGISLPEPASMLLIAVGAPLALQHRNRRR